MTLVERAERAERPAHRRRRGPGPFWAHVAALALVLLALLPVVGTTSSFSADEGAAIIQAQSLADGKGWIVEHPLPQVDPANRYFPLELSAEGSKGVAPFAKHPLYALLLAGADRVGGVTAMVLLSVLGTLAAAVLAAALARRLDPSLRRPTLWVVGLASPLLFDGYLVIAHSLGAAAVAGAALLALVALERRRALVAAATGPLVALAVLLRTEATLLALALAAGLGAVALFELVTGRRAPTRPSVTGSPATPAEPVTLTRAPTRPSVTGSPATPAEPVTLTRAPTRPSVTGSPGVAARAAAAAAGVAAVAAVLGAAGAWLLEKAWATAIVGTPVAPSNPSPTGSDSYSFLGGRLHAFAVTWLRPSYRGPRALDAALILMLAGVVVGAVIVRRRPQDGHALRLSAALAVTGALAGAVLSPHHLVPGLLAAFPLALAGIVLITRRTLATQPARLLAATFALFALAVLATQYAKGGTAEWGGRYFAIGLPLLVPVVLLAIRGHAQTLDRVALRAAGGALLACSVLMSAVGVAALRHTHQFTADAMAAIARTQAPVYIATNGAIPRLAWATFDRQRWLLVPPDELAGVVASLRQADIHRAAFVTHDADHEVPQLGPGVHIAATAPSPGNGWAILTLDLG